MVDCPHSQKDAISFCVMPPQTKSAMMFLKSIRIDYRNSAILVKRQTDIEYRDTDKMEKEERTPFGRRLLDARESAGYTQEDAAKAVGMRSQSTLAEAEISGKRSGFTPQLAALYGVSASWLATGKGAKQSYEALESASSIIGKVPVISWVQAGEFTEAVESRGAEEWVETSAPVLRHTFALRVKGDSMEPEFPAGVIVVVEPDLEPNPGDYVVVRNGGGEATFKQLVRDGEDWYLKPINPRYPIKPLGHSHIVGVVREMIKKFR